jgi:diacylglycerol O-acyltransferase / wax synthase
MKKRRDTVAPAPPRLPSLKGERMAAMDAAWLRLESPSSRMVILSLWLLRPSITLAQLRERVRERLLRHDRFRQRVVESPDGPLWVEDDTLDLAQQVVAETLPRKRTQGLESALKARVAALAAEPLDPDHPLWQMHLVETYDGGSALIVRVHHCIADGLALIAVILSITDGGPRSGRGAAAPASASASASAAAAAAATTTATAGTVSSPADGWTDAFLKPINDWTVRALQQRAGQLRPSAKGATPVDAADFLSAQVASDMAALACVEDDSPTRLKGRPGVSKRVAWSPGLPLDAVQAVSKSLGVSVNDLLMSCVAGAIGAYLRAHGDDPRGQEIRAMVPVNLRPMEEAWQLGNRFGVVPLVLPIGISNPVQRLYAVHSRMRDLKSSLQPVLAFGLMAAAGLLKPEQQVLLNDFQRKATAVMTNVPGPDRPLQFCGATVERVMFWVPQSGDVCVGVSLLTYAGQVQFGLLTDAGLCPDPQAIIDAFEPEFQQLLTLALMLPWEAGG